MSRYLVETGSLYTLAQALERSAEAVDNAMRRSVASACRQLLYQRGSQVRSDAKFLSNSLQNMDALKNDIYLLSSALRMVAETALLGDKAVYALFQGLPVCAVTGRKIIEYDYTALFLDGRNPTVDGCIIGWTGDKFENFKGAIANHLGKLGINVALWDTIPEKMVRNSLETLLAETEDTISEDDPMKNKEFDKVYGFFRNYLSLGIELTDTNIHEIMSSATDDITESEYMQLLIKQDNLVFLKNLSDELDNAFTGVDAFHEISDFSEDLKKELFKDYVKRAMKLEAIKKALLDNGYDNETVNRVVDEMLLEYQSEYLRAIKMGLKTLADKGIDKVIDKTLEKTIGKTKLLSLFLYTIDASNDALGTKKTVGYLEQVYATASYSYALVEEFDHYAKIIRSGSYAPDDIAKCNQYFELARHAKMQEYQAIVDFTKEQLKNPLNFASSVKKEAAQQTLTQLEAEIGRLQALAGTEDTAKQSFDAAFSVGGGGGR